MKLVMDMLTMETTRRCNSRCAHCLRGPAENVDMEDRTVYKLLHQISSIHSLTFTGGEPSLAPGIIEHVFNELAHNRYTSLSYFWVKTNAKRYNSRFAAALSRLYNLCDEEDMCELTISHDQYHDSMSASAIQQYEALPFFQWEPYRPIEYNRLINEGMAKENQLGGTKSIERLTHRSLDDERELFEYNPETDTLFTQDTIVYCNALGDIVLGCDLSYESQKEYSIGNIHEQSLETIIFNALPAEAQQTINDVNKVYV